MGLISTIVSIINLSLAMTLVLAGVQDDPATATEDVGDSSELWADEDAPATDASMEEEATEPAMPTATTDTKTKYPEPDHKGVGLLATTISLGAATLVIAATRGGLWARQLKACESGDANGCSGLGSWTSQIGLAVTQWTLGVSAAGVAPGAGVLMGRYAAWKAAAGGGKKRNPKALIGGGAGLLAGGVATIGTSIALGFIVPGICVKKETESMDGLAGDRCLVRGYAANHVINWAGFSMAGAGGALIGYGVAYKNHTARRYSWNISPYGGFGMAGLSVSGQF